MNSDLWNGEHGIPVADVGACTGKGAAGDDERADGGAALEHRFPRRRAHHRAVEIVRVIFGIAALVDDIRVDSLVADGAGLVGNLVPGVNQVSTGETELLGLILFSLALGPNFGHGVASLHAGSRRGRRSRAGLEIGREPGDVAWRGADWGSGWGEAVLLGVFCGVGAGVRAKIGGFVHVDPEAVYVDAVVLAEELAKFFVPVALGLGVEPVWEDG